MERMSFDAEQVPLKWDAEGTVRVGTTRVTLESLVYAFQEGSSPESIVEQYPAVSLADVYLTLGFYLRHSDEVHRYLLEQQSENDAALREVERLYPTAGLRERLRARRAQAASA